MASRPPPDPIRATPPTAQERARFFTINAVRLGGVALVVIALLIVNHGIDLPEVFGYVFLAVGLVDVFVLPLVLARKWRTPPE